jgi:Alpha/beta hydrolase domain
MTTKTTATFAPAPEGSGTPFGATSLDLAGKGYVEEEYSASGTANRYRMNFTSTDGAGGTAGQPDDPLATAEVVDAGHPYTTRILVRRPTDADSFNGTVIVEWFNVSLSQDVDFIFAATHDYLLSNGYAWVGVSAQLAGTNALKQANPARYSDLNLDASNDDPAGDKLDAQGDVLSWDIFAQVGAALRNRGDVDPLGGLTAKHVIAAGESQAAERLTAYYNSIQPLCLEIYEGFIAYDRFNRVRSDQNAKVISFGSENRRIAFPKKSLPEDSANVRLWEVAGASHASLEEVEGYLDPQFLRNGILRAPDGTVLSLTDVVAECDTQPIWSRVPNGHVVAAAIHAMQLWLKDGVPAPTAPRLETDDSGQLLRDPQGRVLGGIRLATFDAPTAHNGAANTGPEGCSQVGYHIDFTPVELCERYGSQQNYIDQVAQITRKAKRDGFLVSADADRTIEEAKTVKFSGQ